ncbi:MAG: alpha-L-fucosidase [Lentisphaerae bacterium]|nr:alpha-L-fucosidase [Lentisphaerota bacterium]
MTQKSGTAPAADGEFGAYAPSRNYTPPVDPLVLQNLARWQGLKFGVLLDWQACTQWGIDSWQLCPERWDWNKRVDRIRGKPEASEQDDVKYKASYEALQKTFNPTRYDPEKWADILQESGVKYALIMAKHHDGFCLWDTAQTDYKTTSENCPFHRLPGADTVRAVGDALRKRGIRVGVYFSKPDWNTPSYWSPEFPMFPPDFAQHFVGRNANYDPRKHPALWKKFKDFTWAQVEELMKNYGDMDILWLDGGQVNPSTNAQDIDMNGLAAMARAHQPGLLVVDRCVKGANENYITPEGERSMPGSHQAYPWEACMPIGKHWNYTPRDELKSAGALVRYICRAAARGGNLLLGIGPDECGEFESGIVTRLCGVGDWLKRHGEAIYNTAPIAPYEQGNCLFTAGRDGTRYAIVPAGDDMEPMPECVTVPENIPEKGGRISMLPFDDTLFSGVANNGQCMVQVPAAVRSRLTAGMAWVLKFAPPAEGRKPANRTGGC